MKGTAFHSELAHYMKAKDKSNANRVIMRELGVVLVKSREDFIEILKNANVFVPSDATDLQLIDLFVKNATNNRELILGAAFLVNHRNKVSGFDGESEVHDGAVKACYSCMCSCFDGEVEPAEIKQDASYDDYHSNAGGAWAGALQAVSGLGSKIADSQHQKKFGASDALAKQQAARQQLIQSVVDQKKQKQLDSSALAAHKQKKQRLLLIVGGSLLGIALIITAVIVIKSKHK